MVGNPALALSSPSLAPTTRLPPVCPCSFIHSFIEPLPAQLLRTCFLCQDQQREHAAHSPLGRRGVVPAVAAPG